MSVYPFIEEEKQGRRNVKRACELLKVSRAAYYAARDGRPSDRDRQDALGVVLADDVIVEDLADVLGGRHAVA